MSTELQTAEPQRSPFDLLSKPTQELTDTDIEQIVAELRRRRERFLQGIADKPARKPAAPKRTAEEKAAITSSLLGDLSDIKLDL